jgi:hypothetical protein
VFLQRLDILLKNGHLKFNVELILFLQQGGLVFVCGSRDGLMTVTGRKHNADDIIATVLAVEPMKFIYRGRIAVFSIRVLRDERICVIAEQRPDCSEEEVRMYHAAVYITSYNVLSEEMQHNFRLLKIEIYVHAYICTYLLLGTVLHGSH